MPIGFRFPEVTAETLAGTQKTLPDAAQGAPALIVVAFVREAQEMIDSWVTPIREEFQGTDAIAVYELPVIASAIWRPMHRIIDGGMRSGIPVRDHDYVMTVYHNASGLTDELEIDDRSLAYVYLIDSHGTIRWQGSGFAETQTLYRLREMIHTCLREGESGEENKEQKEEPSVPHP